MQTSLSKTEPVAASSHAYPWVPDCGDGTYRNPVLYADYSDPDAIRVGDDFYLTASSFNCTPGLPILHSRDLVNWTIIGHAVQNLPHPRYEKVQPGCGIWAPSIRFHAGKFWIFFPMPDEGIYLVTATDPRGPWSEPHLVQAGKGLIDPCPLWDDDGNAYLVHAYAGSRAGIKHMLRVRPMAPDGSKLLGEGQIVFHAPEKHPTLEGPKFLKKDGWYYILAPAGGVATGWQVVFRSKNIYGPYEDRIVLERGSTEINGPHQGALVEAGVGEWWFIHFQDAGLYGRVLHLQPVTWQDGWPIMGEDQDENGIGEPVLSHCLPKSKTRQPIAVPPTSDEFDATTLGLQWQWHANHKTGWFSLDARPGWLRLFAQHSREAALQNIPNLLLQKLPAPSFHVETLLDFSPQSAGDEVGLVIAGRTSAAIALRHATTGTEIVWRNESTETVIERTTGKSIRLRVHLANGGKCTFLFAHDGGDFQTIPIPFQATAGVWIGAKTGIYCLSSSQNSDAHTDFDYFRFSR
ncbi:MAG TPA: glycoside hydrolase 43 family protein [Candidatus Paceibacterota bacterium]|nr:glycoside hydrolase 43 family protein [Candidatus Paceibacterota bacterium]